MTKPLIYFWMTLTLWYPILTHGYMNLFISHREVMKLMGLEADLFYVHEGAINTYAMHFTVPVPADVYDLEFSWQSLSTHPLPYVITIDYDHEQGALGEPVISIPEKGYIPHHIETFSIHLPCVGNVTKDVPLLVNMLIQGPPHANDTKLHFKRNKICKKGVFPAPNQSLAPAYASSQTPILLGAAACALGLVLVVGLIASAMYVRARKQLQQDSLHTSFSTAAYGSHQNVFIRLDPIGRPPSANSGSYATITSLTKYSPDSKKLYNIFDRFRNPSSTPSPYATALLPINDRITETIYSKPESYCPSRISYYASSHFTQLYNNMATPKSTGGGSNNYADQKDKIRRIPSLQSGTLMLQRSLKEGTYGRIYVGRLVQSCDVLIKTVVDGASLTQVACLLQDAAVFIGLSHPNILAPILANTELPGPPEIVYPYPSKGNLKIFLQSTRESNSPLSTRQLVEFGWNITKGLAYLHTLGIIHKDIATRNCYIELEYESQYCVKICDSGLSQDIFPEDYYCLGDNESRPIQWLALEALQKRHYHTFSDIWSLGVVFWELATLAMTPYEEIDLFKLTAYLADGYRLAQPINCPDEFFTVMSHCWLKEPKQRPTFPQLLAYLESFHKDLGKYI